MDMLPTVKKKPRLNDWRGVQRVSARLLIASREFEVSLALVERSLVLNPNLGQAWRASGITRAYNGELDSAIAHLEYAVRLSSFDPFVHAMWRGIAFAHMMAGRYDQSLSTSDQGLLNDVEDLNVFAASSALAGRMDKARAAMARVREQDPLLRIFALKILVPLRRPEDFARWAEGLRLAGLPE